MADNNLKAKYAHVLRKPRITEKANKMAESNVHAFEIAPSANKMEVARAVKAYYGVSPIKVRIAVNPSKKIFVRGKRGTKNAVKKAYVYLNKKDKLE